MGIQSQIATLMEKLKDLQLVRLARPNIWCTHCMVEGYVTIECLRLWGINHSGGIAGSSGTPPIVGVVAVRVQGVFPGRNNQEYCEIYRMYGHLPRMCLILQKYSNVPNNNYSEFCASTMHHID